MICEADEMHLKLNLFFFVLWTSLELCFPLTLRLFREIPFLPSVSSWMIIFQNVFKLKRDSGSLISIFFKRSAHQIASEPETVLSGSKWRNPIRKVELEKKEGCPWLNSSGEEQWISMISSRWAQNLCKLLFWSESLCPSCRNIRWLIWNSLMNA